MITPDSLWRIGLGEQRRPVRRPVTFQLRDGANLISDRSDRNGAEGTGRKNTESSNETNRNCSEEKTEASVLLT